MLCINGKIELTARERGLLAYPQHKVAQQEIYTEWRYSLLFAGPIQYLIDNEWQDTCAGPLLSPRITKRSDGDGKAFCGKCHRVVAVSPKLAKRIDLCAKFDLGLATPEEVRAYLSTGSAIK